MAYWLTCSGGCGGECCSVARNIIDLLDHHVGSDGRFFCSQCGGPAFIGKKYRKPKGAEGAFEPILKGAFRTLPPEYDSYQPFVFLLGNAEDPEIESVWICHYTDLRSRGGNLRNGAGPGGAPVLDKSLLFSVLSNLIRVGYLSEEEVREGVGRSLGETS